MRISVVWTMRWAYGFFDRFQKRSTNSQIIGCGNFGAPPSPPHSSSNCADTPWNAVNSSSSVSSCAEPRSRSVCPSDSVSWRADCSTSPRRERQASAMAASSFGKPGSP